MFRLLLEKLIGLFDREPVVQASASQTTSKSETASTSDDDWWKEENQMPEYKGDGKECPFCKSTNVLTFRYGLIKLDTPEKEAEWRKTNTRGGCCIDPWSPRYICEDCDKRFGLVKF